MNQSKVSEMHFFGNLDHSKSSKKLFIVSIKVMRSQRDCLEKSLIFLGYVRLLVWGREKGGWEKSLAYFLPRKQKPRKKYALHREL